MLYDQLFRNKFNYANPSDSRETIIYNSLFSERSSQDFVI